MDKENGETVERGGGGEKGGTGAPPDASSLLDAASLFGHSLFGGIPGGFGNHLTGHHMPFAMMGGRGSSSSGYGPPHHPPTTAQGSYGSLGTLSVAASQAASLGINPAILSSEARHCATGAAWWTMASHLAAQDYLARLQASAAASGMSFGGLTGAEGLVPGYSLLSAPHSQPHVSSSKSSSSKSSSSSKLTTTTAASLHSSSTPNLVSSSSASHVSHHRERDREREREKEREREREKDRERERERERERDRENRERDAAASAAPSPHPLPGIISDPTSILGGVRLPPDTEIIKYTSSIVGPKIPGTTNRGRKKTISLDPPSVSVMPTHSSTGLPIERGGRRHPRSRVLQEPPEYRDSPISSSLDRVEVIKLPAYSTNGTLRLNIPNFGSSSSTPENDAPLNLSLKPQSSSAGATPNLSTNSNTSPISLSSSLNTPQPSERTSRRKPGPKPRRVIQTPSPVIPAAPSPSLAQLFAAADSPRPSSGSEESESQIKESRPRNLGRGTSKPKKNTVASLLAQSRALGIKPTPGLDVSPPNNQVSLLKSNVLGSSAQQERGSPQLSPQHSPSSNKGMLTEMEAEAAAAEGEEASALSLMSHPMNAEDSEKEKELDVSSEDTSRTEATKHKRHLVSSRSDGDNKLKIRAVEGLSEDSSAPDVSSESGSGSEEGFPSDSEDGEETENTSKREGEEGTGPVAKRRKLEVDERELRIPLEHGWRRETFISGVSRIGTIKGEVVYYSPCGRRFKQYPDVVRFLEKNNIVDICRENFSFSSRVLIGEFLQPTAGEDFVRLSEEQVMKRLEELRLSRTFKSRSQRGEISRLSQEQKLQQQIEKEKAAVAAKEAKRMAKEEAARQKEQVRLMKEQERTERQEAIRREREQRNQQMMEARRRRQEELEKQRQEEQLRKQQERELKRQQAVIIKEQAVQLYMQELNKQREMLYTVELERERRRQHMVLVKALEARKRLEERERKRQEVRAEKVASRERRMEQRRLELELVRELRKPVEDMELADQKALPTLNRIPGLKLSGQAFADTLMVFEFLHNFGETLGFDMDSLPTLNSLQMALLNDEEAEEELLSVMTHLLVCAIEDPGIPNPARHTTILGQSLKQADITHGNLSEILRIYLYANATGEVKALTGLYFERDREKKSDHHNVYGEIQPPCGKNAAFFEHLHENPTWRMSEWLHELPFLALNPTHKAAILAFLCNELLQNKAVIRQIENSIETVAQLRKERWILDTKIRKMRMLHGRKIRQTMMMAPNKLESNGCEESNDIAGVEGKGKDGDDEDDNDEDAEDAESGNESEGTQPEEEEDKNLTAEELNRKMERLVRQCDNSVQAINTSAQQLRALCFGQDRYWRRYWSLPCAGGVFVEALESAEPELYTEWEDQVSLKKEKLSTQDMEMETCSAQGKLDEEVQKQMCNERLKCSSSSVGAHADDDEKSSAETPYRNAIRKQLQKPLEFEEMEETKNEHRKKRTREKDECLDKGVGTEEVSSWVKKERGLDIDDLVKREFGEDLQNSLIKSFRHIDGDEHEGSKTEDRSDTKVSKQIPNRITNINEVSAVKSEEKDGSASKIKVEGNMICVPSGLTITKSDASESEVKEDSLSAVKVEIKSDLFSTELNAIKKEDKGTGTGCVDPGLVLSSKSDDAFLVHRPIQFERLGECMEKANAETGPVIVPNGDKFNALNHLYNLNSNTIFNNGKELNGSFLLGSTAGALSSERNWFSILPRDACDSTSVTNGTCMASRLMEGSTELRIPVFPPPSRLSSPSPGGSQCESPAPLILTPEEMVQLEQMKKTGPIEPQEAKPVPHELRRGWWRITDEDQLKTIFEKLHSRGVRERELKRVLSKYMEHTKECNRKICVASGDKAATDLDITDMDHKVAALPGGAPLRDGPDDWFPEVALRVDMAILEQVEALEDKVANASMQVKGWKVPSRASTEEGASFRPSCLPAIGENANKKNPIEIAKDRLMSLESAIERRYLKPPLGIRYVPSTGDVNLSGMSGECATTEDNVPKGLVVWREAVGRAHTSAQLAMALYMLEASIAWDKSIMKANCQFCHSGDNEDKLLLCDGCDKGYHTYCFRPKMENIPDGDWYCFECMNKATGERNCIVCGKKAGKNLVTCDACPRAYHTDCLQPPLPKVPRGKWFCPTCQAKQPKKRNSGRRSTSHSKSRDKERESESSSSEQLPPATPPATPAAVTCSDENSCTSLAASSASPTTTPSTPNKKDRGKKIAKDLNPCKNLLEDLEMHDEAWPFLLPVNTKQFPTYRKIIKSPMDLSTIKKKLQEAQYKSREDFCADVRLIFNNCETFNEDDSPVGKAGHSMRSFFETRWGEMNMNHPKTSNTSPTTPNTSSSTSAAMPPT